MDYLSIQEALLAAEILLQNWRKGCDVIYQLHSHWQAQILRYPTITDTCILIIYERMQRKGEYVFGTALETECQPLSVAIAIMQYVDACCQEWAEFVEI